MRKIILVICFLAFIGLIDYPFVARIYNEKVQGSVINDYEGVGESLEETKKKEALDDARAYNAALANRESYSLEDAFMDTREENEWYSSLLSLNKDGVMAVVEIPKLNLELPIYHGTSEEVLQKGAGHLEGSSLPVGGESTHTCLSAHRGLPNKKMFTELDIINVGDVFYVRVYGEVLAYRVYDIETVTPDQTDALNIIEGEDRATLITCTPYGINTHRLYIHGKRIPYEEAQAAAEENANEEEWFLREYWWIGLNIVLFFLLFLLLFILKRLYVKGTRIEYSEEVIEEVAERQEEIRIRDWWWLGLSGILLILMLVILWRYYRN